VVRGERIDVQGIAEAKRSQVVEFFRQEFPGANRVKVEGYQDGPRLRLRFRGVPPAQQQRIRNFLTLVI
jgi:hypothetical protein